MHFVDSEIKHKPDGILLNGSNPTPPQSMYDHKRKIDVSSKKIRQIKSIKIAILYLDTGEFSRACFKCQKAKLEAFQIWAFRRLLQSGS